MKFTISERYESEDKTPVQIGDFLKIISMQEFKANAVEFSDKSLQEQIAGNFVRVIRMRYNHGVWEYICTDTHGKFLEVEIVDSDIEYVIRPTRKYFSVYYNSKGTKRLKAVEQIESDNISKVEVVPLGDWDELSRNSHFGFIIDTIREHSELSDIIYRNGASSIYLSDEKDMEKQKQIYEKIKSW